MDLTLLRRLQSIKDMEENPPFKYEDIDMSTFKAMYPDVIIVDQSLADGTDLPEEVFLPNPCMDKMLHRIVEERDFQVTHGALGDSSTATTKRVNAPSSLAKLELHTNTFTRALSLFQVMSAAKAHWTIILKEGLYINPRFKISPFEGRKDASLEIVGMNGARILLYDNVVGRLKLHGVKVTMRNVSLHDRRDETPLSVAVSRSSEFVNSMAAYEKSDIKLRIILG